MYQIIEQIMKCNQPVSSILLIAIGVGGLGFDFQVAQIGRSVAYGSPPLQCFFGAVLPRH